MLREEMIDLPAYHKALFGELRDTVL